jgi:hypothetical protein
MTGEIEQFRHGNQRILVVVDQKDSHRNNLEPPWLEIRDRGALGPSSLEDLGSESNQVAGDTLNER